MIFLSRITASLCLIFCFLVLSCLDVAAQPPAHLRVMTYNIRYKNTIDGINGWEYRKDKVAALIQYHEADIVGVQEADVDQLRDMGKRMPGYKWYGVPSAEGNDGEYTAIFFSSRFAVRDSGTFWLSEHSHKANSKSWDSFYPRIVSWRKFQDSQSGVEFFFFNTHFDHRGKVARYKAAEVARKQIGLIAGDRPVIFTGDFNTRDTSSAYQKIVEGSQLKDALPLSKFPHYGPVNTASGFAVTDKPIRARIDFIFVNRKVKVIRHATITDQEQGRYYSDHLPVLAAIEISV